MPIAVSAPIASRSSHTESHSSHITNNTLESSHTRNPTIPYLQTGHDFITICTTTSFHWIRSHDPIFALHNDQYAFERGISSGFSLISTQVSHTPTHAHNIFRSRTLSRHLHRFAPL